MLGTRLSIKAFKGDFDRYSQEFADNLAVLCETAGEAFLTYFLQGKGEFPVYTGMAKSSLKPLGRYLGIKVEVNPEEKPYNNEEFGYYQSPETGEEMGEAPPPGDFFIMQKNNYGPFRVTFQWMSLVDHFLENDIYHVPRIRSSTPWGYVAGASIEYDNTIKELSAFIVPSLKSYLAPVQATQNYHEFSQAEQDRILADPRNIPDVSLLEGLDFGEF